MSLPARVRILIVDDHPVVCHGVVAAVRHAPELEVVGVESTARIHRGEQPGGPWHVFASCDLESADAGVTADCWSG